MFFVLFKNMLRTLAVLGDKKGEKLMSGMARSKSRCVSIDTNLAVQTTRGYKLLCIDVC